MIRRLLFVIALSFSFQWVAAQTITDDQVVKIILAEKESGADEETIARKLLQKGATPAQIRRIKEKYEQEQSGLGTVDITGNGGKNNRLRSGKDKNGNFVISKDENAAKEKLPKEKQKKLQKEKEKDMQENMAFLDLDSVLYYKNLLKDETPVFGRNLFNNELLTFEPAMNIPAPADYILGAGDQVIIDVWGASQMTFDNVISPEGFIVAEGVGRIKLAGLTLAEADRYVNTVLSEYYNGS